MTNCREPVISAFVTDEKRPPLGVGSLISVLRQAGHEVEFIDNYLKPHDLTRKGRLRKMGIDAVGIYVSTICFREFMELASGLEKLRRSGDWRGIIVVGGPHPSVQPETIPEFVDHVVVGEGESAILKIMESDCPRIVKAPLITDLDSLPAPPWDDFLPLPYDWSSQWIAAQPVVSMNTSRGCPFSCTFCSVTAIWGRNYRSFSVDWIMDNVEYVTRKYEAKGLYFREDNFTVSRKRVLEFCDRMMTNHRGLEWICETRVDSLDRELIRTMHDAGCRAFYFGVESGSQRLLNFLKKGIRTEQIEQVFAWCKEIGINAYASMIVGVPSETEEDREATRRMLDRVRPEFVGNNIFVGIPTSHLYTYVLEKKEYCFIDDRGMAYMKGHDQRVTRYYSDKEQHKIPHTYRERYVRATRFLLERKRLKAIGFALAALAGNPLQWKYQKLFLKTLTPETLLRIRRVILGVNPTAQGETNNGSKRP